jgi:hypothetical protein
MAKNGDLAVLCSGWSNVKQPRVSRQGLFLDAVLDGYHMGVTVWKALALSK